MTKYTSTEKDWSIKENGDGLVGMLKFEAQRSSFETPNMRSRPYCDALDYIYYLKRKLREKRRREWLAMSFLFGMGFCFFYGIAKLRGWF